MPLNQEPIVNARIPYVNGGVFAYVNTTTFTMTDCQASNSTNEIDMSVDTVSGTTTVDFAVVGAVNGLDTGAIAANKCYAVHLIASALDSTISGWLISLSATAPYLPTGYGVFRQVGWVFVDNSSHIYLMYVNGDGNTKTYQFDDTLVAVSAGNATTATQVALTKFTPPRATEVNFYAALTPGAASRTVKFLHSGSTSSLPVTITGQVTSVVISQTFSMLSALNTGVPEILYLVSNSGDAVSIYVTGFVDYL